MTPSAAKALSAARAIFASRYSGAAFAFAAGSIVRGDGTRHSDLDLVVIYDRVDAGSRESFMFEGLPVEAFVHDLQTLAWFVDADIKRGCPTLAHLIAEGVIVGNALVLAQLLQREMADRLAEGPSPLDPDKLRWLRYDITDAVDDLLGERSQTEIIAIGCALYPLLVEIALRGRGRWLGFGKWAPRLIKAVDAELADAFDQAFGALFTAGDLQPVIDLAERELRPHGGRLFDGDRQAAPSTWRVCRHVD